MRRLAGLIAIGTTLLLFLTAAPARATASGRNGRIAFRRYFNTRHTRGSLFTINPDGTAEREVLHPGRTKVATEPDWSPDGRWIVYNIWPHGDDNRSRIFTIHPNGHHRTYVDQSCTAPCLSDAFAQFSPDGRWLVFQRELGPSESQINVSAIFVMSADGTHVRQVTQPSATGQEQQPFLDGGPTWSSDGRHLAFTRTKRSSERTALFTVRVNGADLRRITSWRISPGQPDYSPDGRWIAFYAKDQSTVQLIHPSGRGRHVIANDPVSYSSLSFSPNGRKITVGHRFSDPGNPDIYTMNLDGTHVRDVTNTNGYESAPDWGPQPS